MVKLRHPLACLVVPLMALLPAPPAEAHIELTPLFVNRYVIVKARANRLDLEMSLLFGTLPAGEERKRMDRDGDGTISAAEVGDEEKAWAARAGTALTLTLDGQPIPLALSTRIDLGGDLSAGAKPFTVEYRGSVPVDSSEHQIVLEAGPDLPRMGETEFFLETTPPWGLHATLDENRQPLPPQAVVRQALPRAAPEQKRGATFVIRPGAGGRATQPGLAMPIALVVLAIVLGATLMLVIRRLDRQRTTR